MRQEFPVALEYGKEYRSRYVPPGTKPWDIRQIAAAAKEVAARQQARKEAKQVSMVPFEYSAYLQQITFQARQAQREKEEEEYRERIAAAPTKYTTFLQEITAYARDVRRLAEQKVAVAQYGPGKGETAEKLLAETEKMAAKVEVEEKPPKSVTEWLLGVSDVLKIEFTLPGREEKITVGKWTPFEAPAEVLAGITGSFESFGYTLGRLVGFKTPAPPPTLTGGLFGKGVSVFTGQPSYELEAVLEKPRYGAWTLAGDVLLSWVLGKGFEKAVAKPIQRKATTWLTERYIEKGPLEWKGRLEKFVGTITRAKPQLAPQIVSVPSPTTPMAAFKAEQAWTFATTPRTSLLELGGVTGASSRLKSWVAEKWIKKALGGLSYALVQEEVMKPRPTLPYLPKVPAARKIATEPFFAVGAALTAFQKQLTGKVAFAPKQEVFKPKPWITPKTTIPQLKKQLRPVSAVEKPRLLTREKQRLKPWQWPKLAPITAPTISLKGLAKTWSIQLPKTALVTKQAAKAKQVVKTKQIAKTVQKMAAPQMLKMPTPQLLKMAPAWPLYRRPTPSAFSKQFRKRYAAWFKREHPIPTARQVAERFGLVRKKRKKRKKRR